MSPIKRTILILDKRIRDAEVELRQTSIGIELFGKDGMPLTSDDPRFTKIESLLQFIWMAHVAVKFLRSLK